MSFILHFCLCGSYSAAMYSTTLIAAPSDISFLIDVRESRVEILRESIVESTWLSVMLTCNHDQRVDFAVSH